MIVADLEGAQAVVEEESRTGARGRPGRPVALRGDRFLALGLELNVDYVAGVVLDLTGEVQLVETRPVPLDGPGREAALRGAGPATRYAARPATRGTSWSAPRWPSPAWCAPTTGPSPGHPTSASPVTPWRPGSSEELGGLGLRGPVRVSNDANCAAYAETHHGAATDSSHVLYLTGTVGIGAGIVEDGDLVRGAAGFAGEVGHMPVGDPAARCGCGRQGCWEASIGLHAMLDAVGMAELATPIATAEAVAARAGSDPRVREALAGWAATSGWGSPSSRPCSTPRWSSWAATSRRWATWCSPRLAGPSTSGWSPTSSAVPSSGPAPSASRPPPSVPPSGPSATCSRGSCDASTPR